MYAGQSAYNCVELSKIKSYRAPRDKVICVLNSCKVIFGMTWPGNLAL